MSRTIPKILTTILATLFSFQGAFAEIEEIVVTATKRVENIQDVPIAVTAISETQLERAGVDTFRDLPRLSSSFTMNSTDTQTGSATFRIRGVGTTGNNIGLEQSVGVFLDGVYISRPGIALSDMMDVQQIEVLRGPQGTLFGRNTSAGAVSIQSKKASVTESEGFAVLGAGNYNGSSLQAGYSAPLIQDKLGFRINGSIRKRDGWLETPQRSSVGYTDGYEVDRTGLRGQVQWEINDNSSLRVIADYHTSDEACCGSVILGETPFASFFPAAGLPADGGNPNGNGDIDDLRSAAGDLGAEIDQWGISAEYNWEGELGSFTYIGSYRSFETDVQRSDFVAIENFQMPGTNGYKFEDKIETMTHEFRFQGNSGSLDWMVGAYYQEEDIQQTFPLELGADYQAHGSAVYFMPLFLRSPLISSLPDSTPLALGGTLGDVRSSNNPARVFANNIDATGNFAANKFNQEGSSWSVFTHNTLQITENLDLVLGMRWVDEKKDGRFVQLDAFSPACNAAIINQQRLEASIGIPAGVFGGAAVFAGCFAFSVEADQQLPAGLVNTLPQTFDDSWDDDELVYTVKAVYRITDDIQTYASVSHGFKSGGFNLDATAAILGSNPVFDSEVVDSYELGLKSDLFDGSLRLNLAIYRMEMDDYQILEFTGAQFKTFNVDVAESDGFELEMTWLPTDNLKLSLGYTKSDARYPDDCDGGDPAADISVALLCGFELTNSPESTAIAGLDYDTELPGGNLALFFSTNARWEDDKRVGTQAINAAGVPLAFDIQEAHTKVDARLGIGRTDGSWIVEIWGTNLTDEVTTGLAYNVPLRIASRGAFIQAPRLYGATFRMNF